MYAAVPDPYRRGFPVPLEVRKDLLGKFVPAVDSIHGLQRSVGIELPAARFDPAHERCRLLRVSQAYQGIQGEGGVADPRVPVIPVALPPDLLRKTERRSGDDRTGGMGSQEFQREGGPVHHLAPPPLVVRTGHPPTPEVERILERSGHIVFPGRGGLITLPRLLENEEGGLPRTKRKLGGDRTVLRTKRDVRPESNRLQPFSVGMEDGPPVPDLHPVRSTPVVEPGIAHHAETNLSPHGLHTADEVVPVPRVVLDRHEIRYLGDTFLREEPGKEDIRVGEIELLLSCTVENGSDAEPSPFFLVEDRSEDRRRVEIRETHEVDRTVHTDESDRVQVPDDTVILDRLVVHTHLLTGFKQPGRSVGNPDGEFRFAMGRIAVSGGIAQTDPATAFPFRRFVGIERVNKRKKRSRRNGRDSIRANSRNGWWYLNPSPAVPPGWSRPRHASGNRG